MKKNSTLLKIFYVLSITGLISTECGASAPLDIKAIKDKYPCPTLNYDQLKKIRDAGKNYVTINGLNIKTNMSAKDFKDNIPSGVYIVSKGKDFTPLANPDVKDNTALAQITCSYEWSSAVLSKPYKFNVSFDVPPIRSQAGDVQKKFNICTFDGGGFRGVGTATILATMESKLGKKIYDICDMMIGTSTGGLIAIMAGEGYSATAILDFYLKNGPDIFQKTFSKKLRSVGGLIGSKFTKDPLENIIKSTFPDYDKKVASEMKELKKLYGAVVHDPVTNQPGIVSNWATAGYSVDFSVMDLAMATSAAPTYFKGREVAGKLWVDGGLSANDPSALAYLEAKKILPEGAKIRVLSFGTGAGNEEGLPRNSGIIHIKKIIEAFSQGGASGSQKVVMGLLSETDPNLEYIRIQFKLPEKYDLADTREKVINSLMKSAYERTQQADFSNLMKNLSQEIRQ